ncbi:MAG: hypothetical protein H3C26_06015 [Rhodocyclaceae bacterium]|nr:hypothetical protein [Rhodocyclaceae bacterium]
MKRPNLSSWATAGWLAVLSLLSAAAWAGPGHDHGEAPAAADGIVVPSVTAVSETFELVGRLDGGELAILVDRADSNEPVLGAALSVALLGGFEGRAADAVFRPERGDYALTDAALLVELAKPGVRSLMFTLLAGAESDLLAGELDVHDDAAAVAEPHRDWPTYAAWAAAALAGLALLYAAARRRTTHAGGAA